MQIKSIVIYNKLGEFRELPFELNSLNVITGKSRTGKSAIISIIDYCMGRSTFNIFDGVNKDVVSWYAVTFQFSEKQIFVAKKPPKNNGASNSEACLFVGRDIGIPKFDSLINNTNDDGVRAQIEAELDLNDNVTFRTEASDSSYKANLKHAKSFVFQEQGEIANKKILFHRQDEPFLDQAIKDTFPFFLGAITNERLSKMSLLKDKKSKLKKLEYQVKQLKDVISDGNQRAVQLLIEAANLGLLEGTLISNELEFDKCVELLKGCANWTPEEVRGKSGDDLYLLQSDLVDLEKESAVYKEKIAESKIFEKHHSTYEGNIHAHKNRLSAINFFDSDATSICPVCGSNDNQINFQSLTNLLAETNERLEKITQSSPRLNSYINNLSSQENEVQIKIDDHREKIRKIISMRKESKIIQDRNSYIAKTLGRISLFLESVGETKPDADLLKEIEELKHEITLLQDEMNSESVNDKINSSLNIVGSYMSEFAKKLKLEYAKYPYRLDIPKLTVFADSPHGGVPMHRQGSGENWLGCHVITLLSLHKFFLEKNSPVPSFLIIDQPSQVHFPDMAFYKSLEGNLGSYSDVDMIQVTNLFKLFYDFCAAEVYGFQIIVTEHANIDQDWFQSSLVEDPWRGNNALIPYDWINAIDNS